MARVLRLAELVRAVRPEELLRTPAAPHRGRASRERAGRRAHCSPQSHVRAHPGQLQHQHKKHATHKGLAHERVRADCARAPRPPHPPARRYPHIWLKNGGELKLPEEHNATYAQVMPALYSICRHDYGFEHEEERVCKAMFQRTEIKCARTHARTHAYASSMCTQSWHGHRRQHDDVCVCV
jgi:hypothetical protein